MSGKIVYRPDRPMNIKIGRGDNGEQCFLRQRHREQSWPWPFAPAYGNIDIVAGECHAPVRGVDGYRYCRIRLLEGFQVGNEPAGGESGRTTYCQLVSWREARQTLSSTGQQRDRFGNIA